MVAPKPDITGQRFGALTVLGKSSTRVRCGGVHIPWRLRCDCGKEIELIRGWFDRRGYGQKSCGCLQKVKGTHAPRSMPRRWREPLDLSGEVFGELTVIATIPGGRDNSGKQQRVRYLCKCVCGGEVIKTNVDLARSRRAKRGSFLNCRGDQHLVGAWYPPMPTPMPPEVGRLVVKYSYLCEETIPTGAYFKRSASIDKAIVRDYKADRLERVCWIVVFRRSQGESLSEKFERNYIRKSLAYGYQEAFVRYYRSRKPIQIGDRMAPDLSAKDGTKKTVSELLLPVPKKLTYSRC